MEDRVSASELIEWQEYFSLYPAFEDRNEIQMAILIQSIVNTNSKKKAKYQDFLISNQQSKSKPKLKGKDLEQYIFKMMG